jgi:hypothetical protein
MKHLILILFAILALQIEAFACTSAIVAPQRSSEGVPLLWKHRDNNKYPNTRIDYISGGKYAYTAVVPNGKSYARVVYAGINEKGFGVISTATSHLPEATPEEYQACQRRLLKGSAMVNGLRECATVDEFEEMLKTTKRRHRSHTNIGVGDASGAVAYFEVWDLDYRRYDANESGNNGFDVRANFSHAGNPEKKGASERRYNLIMREMGKHKGDFTPQDLIGYSRSYNSIKYGNVLASEERYVCANHTVPRASTVGSFVVVCDGENPRMLAINGHSVSGLAVPVYVKAKRDIPQCVKGDAMRLLSNDFKAKAYVREFGKSRVLNKDLVRKVLRIKQPKIKMPQQLPSNIRVFNAEIDKKFAVYETKVRKVLVK